MLMDRISISWSHRGYRDGLADRTIGSRERFIGLCAGLRHDSHSTLATRQRPATAVHPDFWDDRVPDGIKQH